MRNEWYRSWTFHWDLAFREKANWGYKNLWLSEFVVQFYQQQFLYISTVSSKSWQTIILHCWNCAKNLNYASTMKKWNCKFSAITAFFQITFFSHKSTAFFQITFFSHESKNWAWRFRKAVYFGPRKRNCKQTDFELTSECLSSQIQ